MEEKVKNDLRKIFNKHDPIRIYQDDETNIHEYDLEIGQLDVDLKHSKNVEEFTDHLHKIFCNMFDLKMAGEKENYKKFASEVYSYLKNRNEL